MNNFRVKNIHSCRLDGVFKSVIGCEKGKNILKAILEEILEIKIDKIELLNRLSNSHAFDNLLTLMNNDYRNN